MKLLFLLAGPCWALCINAGGPTTFGADGISVQCFADSMFTGGAPYVDLSPVAGDPTMQTLRFGTTFTYTIPANPGPSTAAPGFYLVSLGFVDPNVTTPGGRVFYATVNGQRTPNIDLAVLTGGVKKLYVLRLPVISYGQVTITFTTVIRSAVVSWIDVSPMRATDIFSASDAQAVQAGTLQAYRDMVVNHPCVTGHPGTDPLTGVCPPGFNGFLAAEWVRLKGTPGPICLKMDVSPAGLGVIQESASQSCLADSSWWYRKDASGNEL